MVRNLANFVGSATRSSAEAADAVQSRQYCLVCEYDLQDEAQYVSHRVCPQCRFHYSMTARERIDSLTDPNSFGEINRTMISLDPLSFPQTGSYNSRLFDDQRRTGLTEAVVTGTAAIAGIPVMMIVLDFGFMGGTMGCVVGEKVTLALERAVKRGLSTVAIVTSGGARIQEGALSLMQMAKTAAAANRLNDAGLPFITVLANPATGQAYGSFANLADIILAEPGAIVGFSSLRVIKRASDQPLPTGAHTAESHMAHGMLDAVTQRTELRTVIGVLLELLGAQYRLASARRPIRHSADVARPQAWTAVQMARHESRPTSSDFLSRILSQFVEFHGDRAYGDDQTVICGLGQIAGQTVSIIAQQRSTVIDELEDVHGESRTTPEGFRKAQRMMRLAAKFGIPVVTLVDTAGPDLSEGAEVRGLGNSIANTMALMSGLSVPTIAVVLGQAGSGGALALGIADSVLMLEHAIYTAVSPEEAAEVIYQDPSRAEEAANSLRLTALDCLELGIVDRVVAEPPNGAHADPDEAARLLGRAIVAELARLQTIPAKKRTKRRYSKYRGMGEYSSQIRATLTKEVDSLRHMVKSGLSRLAGRSDRNQLLDEPTGRIATNGHVYSPDE